MADPSETNNNPGEGSPDDFNSWDWHRIMTAIVGYYGNNADSGLSNPQSIYTAANTLEYVKNTLQMVSQSIQDQADALSYGDDAPWKGEAATAFNQMMYSLSRNIHANAQVLGGDVPEDDIPNQIYHNGQHLEYAQQTLHDIDHWYADQAVKRGAQVIDNVVMVHEDQQVVDAMNKDMRSVITSLSNHYTVTNDGFTPPDTSDHGGPNGTGGNQPPPPPPVDPYNPNGGPNPYNNPNDPFGNNGPNGPSNPFNDNFNAQNGPNGPGGSNFNPPPVKNFDVPNDPNGTGGGPGGGGGSAFNPPPVSNFPGGGPADLSNFPGGSNPNNLSNFPGGSDPNNLSSFNPPPVSNFPGGGDPTNGGANGGSNLGGQDFVPPPVSNFPGLGNNLGGSNGLDGSKGLNNSGLNLSDPFKDSGGLDTSGLGNNIKAPLTNFPGDTGGVGGGASGLGSDGLGGLGSNLESSAPPPLSEFPGLNTDTSNLDGSNNAGAGQQPGGSPMMPPGGMGGMGGAGNQGKDPGKSDASGLLNPIKFPGDLTGGFDSSNLLHGGGGASSGGGGGLSGLSGFDGLKGLEGTSGGGSSDLLPLSGFPGSTDVSDPSLANLGGENGLNGFGSDPTGLTTQGLAGGGAPGAPGAGSPMMPPGGMGGMGGAGQQGKEPGKSDASGLLNPTMFPGGAVDNAGDPSVLITGGAGASGGSGGLSGLSIPPVPEAAPVGQPDEGISVETPVLPVQETGQPQQMLPGGPMMTAPPADPTQQSGTTRSEASNLLAPNQAAFSDNGFAEPGPHHGHPGGTEHHAVENEPPASPDRVAMVHEPDGVEDFAAWDAGGAASAAVLPWLFGRRGKDGGDGDLRTDAPAEDNDKWAQGDLSGVPAPAEQQHLATWRPEKVVPGSGPAEEVVYRSSGEMPPPRPEPEPEPAADAGAATDSEETEEEPERTSADLLDRRSEQWDTRGSDLPGVLG